MIDWAIQVVMVIVFLHIIVSINMFGNGHIFSHSAKTQEEQLADLEEADRTRFVDYAQRESLIPLTVCMLVVLGGFFVYVAGIKIIGKLLFKILCFIIPTSGDSLDYFEDMTAISRPLKTAKASGWVKGLDTYNIAHNPLYKDAFKMRGDDDDDRPNPIQA